MVGGADYARSTFNRATRSKRQPGSAFKPFVYAAALSHGYSPVSVLSGLTRVSAPGDPEWMPEERQPRRRGRADAAGGAPRVEQRRRGRSAAAGRLRRGAPRSRRTRASQDLPDVPSLALGSGRSDAARADRGLRRVSGGGPVVAAARAAVGRRCGRHRGVRAADRRQTRVDVGGGGVSDGQHAARRHRSRHRQRRRGRWACTGPVGGKTGTTDDYRDAWFVGFSSSVVAGVWVGFDQPAPIGRDAYAARIALPIWADFMKRQCAGACRPRSSPCPAGDRRRVELCSVSLPACRWTAVRPTIEYFKRGRRACRPRAARMHRDRWSQRRSGPSADSSRSHSAAELGHLRPPEVGRLAAVAASSCHSRPFASFLFIRLPSSSAARGARVCPALAAG